MKIEKPTDYSIECASDPKASRPYVWESSDYHDMDDDEEAYSLSFDFEGQSTTVTYYPSREGVKLVASDSPGYEEGKHRTVFGLVLMKLLLRGDNFCREL